jgi:hypothetical protein
MSNSTQQGLGAGAQTRDTVTDLVMRVAIANAMAAHGDDRGAARPLLHHSRPRGDYSSIRQGFRELAYEIKGMLALGRVRLAQTSSERLSGSPARPVCPEIP